jgi:hypothetical protein
MRPIAIPIGWRRSVVSFVTIVSIIETHLGHPSGAMDSSGLYLAALDRTA